MFERDSESGALASVASVSVLDETNEIAGEVAGFALSTTTNTLFVSMADVAQNGGIAVFDLEVRPPWKMSIPAPRWPFARNQMSVSASVHVCGDRICETKVALRTKDMSDPQLHHSHVLCRV